MHAGHWEEWVVGVGSHDDAPPPAELNFVASGIEAERFVKKFDQMLTFLHAWYLQSCSEREFRAGEFA